MRKFILLSLLISLPLMAVVPVPEEKNPHSHIVMPTDAKMGLFELALTLGGGSAAVIVGTPLVPAIAVGVGFATIVSIFSGSKNTTSTSSSGVPGRVYDENGFYKDENGKWQNPNTAIETPKKEEVFIVKDCGPLPVTDPATLKRQAEREAQLKANREAQYQAQRDAQMKAQREEAEKATREWTQTAWNYGRSYDTISETLSTPPRGGPNNDDHEKVHWEPPHYDRDKKEHEREQEWWR